MEGDVSWLDLSALGVGAKQRGGDHGAEHGHAGEQRESDLEAVA